MINPIIGQSLEIVVNLSSRSGDKGDHRLLTLIYHRVLDRLDFMIPTEMYREKFEWQMGLLAKHFRVFPLFEALQRQQEGTLPARSVAITFDDGYADNYLTALPILKKFNLPSTFFIASGYLDGGRMWNDTVIESMRSMNAHELDLNNEGLGCFDLSTREKRSSEARRLVLLLKHQQPQQRNQLTEKIASHCNNRLPENLMMTSDQLIALHKSGMCIGGHTISHPILAVLDSKTATMEIQGGKTALEEIIDDEITLFAYPNGKAREDYQEKDISIVAETGFLAAVTTEWGVSQQSTGRYEIPRFTPWDNSPARFMARMAMMYRNAV